MLLLVSPTNMRPGVPAHYVCGVALSDSFLPGCYGDHFEDSWVFRLTTIVITFTFKFRVIITKIIISQSHIVTYTIDETSYDV